MWIDIALPGSLLLAKLLLRVLIDRSVTTADWVSAILALPIDIVFLAASLVAAHTITNPENVKDGLLQIITCLAFASFTVFLSRRSDGFFSADRYIATVLAAAINYSISMFILGSSLILLASKVAK
jgi:hypothetical protein